MIEKKRGLKYLMLHFFASHTRCKYLAAWLHAHFLFLLNIKIIHEVAVIAINLIFKIFNPELE